MARVEGVDDHLVHTERLLFAVNCPAMTSALKRTWPARETLQEGILFVADQQAALVTEILPPGQSNIRYSYRVHTGIPERIELVSVKSIAGHASLELTWCARGGEQYVAWEFPAEAADELNQIVNMLGGWQAVEHDRRLRRANGFTASALRYVAARGMSRHNAERKWLVLTDEHSRSLRLVDRQIVLRAVTALVRKD